jgi:hypothetical protein
MHKCKFFKLLQLKTYKKKKKNNIVAKKTRLKVMIFIVKYSEEKIN